MDWEKNSRYLHKISFLTTTIVQDPYTLLFFVSVKPLLFGFGDVKEVNANPGKTRTDCRNELLCGLFILIGMR